MHPKSTQKHFLFILIISIYDFPGFLCQNTDEQYAICSQPFQCGGIRNISYPFWGGSRPLFCGYPGFELQCHRDAPLLSISSLSYQILEIDSSTYTLKVAREDLWNNTCPKVLRNTTLDPNFFEFSPDSDDEKVTLFFDCTIRNQKRLLNQFSCDVDGVKTLNLFKPGDASSGLGSNISCRNNISVPVNQAAARALETPTASSINVLQAALASGFFIRWSADNVNCRTCRRNGGTCAYNPNTASTFCYINSQGSLQVGPPPPPPPAFAVEEPQGTPPVQSPASTPEYFINNNGPDQNHPPQPPPGLLPMIIGTILGVITAIFIASIIIYCRLKRRNGPDQKYNQDVEKFLIQHGSLAPKRYKYSEIKKITKSFSDKLGEGGYGTVYKGRLSDGSLVAVKILVENDSNGEEFINEVASISKTSHVNIVNLLGFCYDRNKRALIYEFMPNKSLDKFITSDYQQLDLEKLYKISLGVAKGLEYLHTRVKKIILVL